MQNYIEKEQKKNKVINRRNSGNPFPTGVLAD